MIRTTSRKLLYNGFAAALIGVTLVGCNQSGTTNTSTTETTTAPAASRESPSVAPGASAGNEAPAELSALFPGATLTKKPFPMDAGAAAHMSEEGDVKFTGKEGEWEVYEAAQNGQRVGLAIMTHSDLPSGGDMHIAFAVDKDFKIVKTDVVEAPDVAPMKTFVAQTIGKGHDAAFKVGKDLKTTSGVSPQVAQVAADAVHKGIIILEENFNPSHGEDEAAHGADHGADDGHNH